METITKSHRGRLWPYIAVCVLSLVVPEIVVAVRDHEAAIESCAGEPTRHLDVPLQLVQRGGYVVGTRAEALAFVREHGGDAVSRMRTGGRWNLATPDAYSPRPAFEHGGEGVAAGRVVFLVSHASSGGRPALLEREASPMGLSGYACMYAVDVPVVAAGTRWMVRDGRVVVRSDPVQVRRQRRRMHPRRTEYYWVTIDVPVPATVERFYVDRTGSIYHQHVGVPQEPVWPGV